jgi:hypothetical protein
MSNTNLTTVDTNNLSSDQKRACTEMLGQFYDLTEGAEVHCVSQEQYFLANYVAGQIGRLDLEIIFEDREIILEQNVPRILATRLPGASPVGFSSKELSLEEALASLLQFADPSLRDRSKLLGLLLGGKSVCTNFWSYQIIIEPLHF